MKPMGNLTHQSKHMNHRTGKLLVRHGHSIHIFHKQDAPTNPETLSHQAKLVDFSKYGVTDGRTNGMFRLEKFQEAHVFGLANLYDFDRIVLAGPHAPSAIDCAVGALTQSLNHTVIWNINRQSRTTARPSALRQARAAPADTRKPLRESLHGL